MPNLCAVRPGFAGGCRMQHAQVGGPDYESAKGQMRTITQARGRHQLVNPVAISIHR
jgi:hypothetical protein